MEIIEKYGIAEEDAKLLLEALHNKAINLLLGAGASYGAIGGDGIELKGGADLAQELNTKFNLGLEPPDSTNLPLVYGDLESTPLSKIATNEFFQARYNKCKPTWQKTLGKLPWKRIWTLNIDDTLDSCVEKSISEIYLWCDDYKPRALKQNGTQIIYLHGKASQLKENPNCLIFSLREYLSRNENIPGWHFSFKNEWIQKPFIVCGARLQEEFDLEVVLSFGNQSRVRGGCPSLIVLRSFAPGQAERYRKRGLIPVKADGDQFFSSLDRDYTEWKKSIPSSTPLLDMAKIEILSKFRELKPEQTLLRRTLDFYSSAETKWEHITQNLDFPFFQTVKSAEWLATETESKIKVTLVHGGTVSGKSAATLRIAAELLKNGHEAWLFRAEERFDENTIAEYSKHKKSVIIFDDCADFSSSIKGLITKSIAEKSKLKIIASCDTHRLRAVKADLSEVNFNEVNLEPISREDFLGLFNKRSEKGRLGRLSKTSESEAWKDFKRKYSGHLLEWLENLENAHSFKDAIASIFRDPDFKSKNIMKLIVATACCHRFGYSLPYMLADEFSPNIDLESIFDENSQLHDIGYLDDRGARLRSTAFSKFVWNEVPSDLKYKISLSTVKSLAPVVVPQSIANRTAPYLVVRALMDHEVIKSDFGKLADQWYSELEKIFGWNARFWEQRALLASDENRDSEAYSYAKKAVSILERDSFPHTTLGKVCVKIGIARKDEVGVDRFWEGVEELRKSRELSIEKNLEWEHPYTTFFSYTLKAIQEPHFEKELEKLSSTWKEWMQAARNSQTLAFDSEGRSTLERFQRQWLLSAVSS
ncbi:hypothetical protein ABS648_16700 [Pseudomonas solani]|uniref:Novel STAND NTPase 5 domain-containing protein n=1 Tax=Pseudomonas solani TaxID=2731552 RepID=A0AAU7XUG4_9PSED